MARATRRQSVKNSSGNHEVTSSPQTPRTRGGKRKASEINNDTNHTSPNINNDSAEGSGNAEYQFKPDELSLIKLAISNNLTRRTCPKLIGLDNEYTKVASLIEQTVSAGESNSLLIIGARGSGKTALVNTILADQTRKYQDTFHVIRLNGFVQTDDKIAIREIWRQLGREMDLNDDNLIKNYADTLTTLLALLGYQGGDSNESGKRSKSIIFILDEFDLFTGHPRQTLLYNLFDIAQSRKAPIAVLGLTTRYDVAIELLEKRVKSRFSHRQVLLTLAKDVSTYKEMCKSSLLLLFDRETSLPSDPQTSLSSTCVTEWNNLVSALMSDSLPFHNHSLQLYHTTKSVPAFQTSLLLPLSSLSTEKALTSSQITSHLLLQLSLAPSLLPPSTSVLQCTVLPSLSTLELALLICAARTQYIHITESTSFALSYDEYKSLASKARIAASAAGQIVTGGVGRLYGGRIAERAWERLVEKGLMVGLSAGGMVLGDGIGAGGSNTGLGVGTGLSQGGRGEGKGLYRCDISLEELGLWLDTEEGKEVGEGGMRKWCRDL